MRLNQIDCFDKFILLKRKSITCKDQLIEFTIEFRWENQIVAGMGSWDRIHYCIPQNFRNPGYLFTNQQIYVFNPINWTNRSDVSAFGLENDFTTRIRLLFRPDRIQLPRRYSSPEKKHSPLFWINHTLREFSIMKVIVSAIRYFSWRNTEQGHLWCTLVDKKQRKRKTPGGTLF